MLYEFRVKGANDWESTPIETVDDFPHDYAAYAFGRGLSNRCKKEVRMNLHGSYQGTYIRPFVENRLQQWATGSTGGSSADLLYRSYYDGPQGAKFELLREIHHTPEDVKKAKAFLRANFDVVSISVVEEREVLQ
jgi:hypothetical protein